MRYVHSIHIGAFAAVVSHLFIRTPTDHPIMTVWFGVGVACLAYALMPKDEK